MIYPSGWAGGWLLALCSLPLAWKAWRTGADNTNRWFMWMWLLGEIFSLAYALTLTGAAPLLLNYAVNIAGIAVVMRFNYFPRAS